ncbi:MAG: ABC transporter permease [Planctomycetota bacterium]
MTLLIGALTIGLILSLLALGVYISFRIFNFPDITADGSFALGGAVAAILVVSGWGPFLATGVAILAGMAAGAATGVLHTKFSIHGLLAGILVMTALYSVNLHVMGKSNVPLLSETTLATRAASAGEWIEGGKEALIIAGWEVLVSDLSVLICTSAMIVLACIVLYIFFRTNLGTSMRATGDNPQMIRALGVNVGNMIVVGLALANGLIALSGALLAQYQGFADVQMGIGMVVLGLASVIIGEALVGHMTLGLTITGAVMGAVLFRLLVAIALRWGLDPNDLKLVTALFVFAALVLPGILKRFTKKKIGVANA